MRIDQDLCIGCNICVACCPVDAISMRNKKAEIDLMMCVECGVCARVQVCPTDAFVPETLSWPRSFAQFLSDPTITKKETGVPGRGTEEVKTNDVTGRVRRGELGLCIEPGRPGVGASMRDVQKIITVLAAVGVRFEANNPLTFLMVNKKTGQLKDEVLDQHVLSCIIECIVPTDKLLEIIDALKKVEQEINTVFSLGIMTRVEPDGTIPVMQTLKQVGVQAYPNGKVNLGLGKPLQNA